MSLGSRLIGAALIVATEALASSTPAANPDPGTSAGGYAIASRQGSSAYYWQTTPVGNQAELITLFCRGCAQPAGASDVPLVAVLRDTLGDSDPTNDRLASVWLLSYVRPDAGRRILSAVPFFYWRVGEGSTHVKAQNVAPLLDLTALQHPLFDKVGRDVLQWGMLDTIAMPVRASSRAYRANEGDDERLHIEQAISYLEAAPVGASGLTVAQRNTLVARLELRKTLLGGLATERGADRLGQDAAVRNDAVRSRDWELLRQCADKTGLYFEPLSIAGTQNQYAALWFPLDESAPPAHRRLPAIWKLLNIKDPWKDPALRHPGVPTYLRALDSQGNLLPFGVAGESTVHLTPLGVYSLDYPKMPLLLVDFRAKRRLKWQEMTQRSINEVTAGVIGVSHFTNWYYYVGADFYDFVASRHGSAMNQSQRLDSYSQLRARLPLDHQLDPALRAEMQQRLETLAINPLEAAPQKEMQAALERYYVLQTEAQNGRLLTLVDRDRRAELAIDHDSPQQVSWHSFLHVASLGAYTQRAQDDPGNAAQVAHYRQVQAQLSTLDRATQSDTQPEVVYDAVRLEEAVSVLRTELPYIESPVLRARIAATLQRVNNLTQDAALKNDASAVLARLEPAPRTAGKQIALEPASVRTGVGSRR